MQIQNNPIQIPLVAMEQTLADAQNQGSDLAEKLLKMNVMQQVDVSQLDYMGTIIDLYV